MKKSTIWLLALVMFTAFFALLFLQVRYMRTSMAIRAQQFDEQVNRSLYNVMRDLEQDQTRDYLEQDMIESENRYSQYNQPQGTQPINREQTTATITNPDGSETGIELDITQRTTRPQEQREQVFLSPNQGAGTISKTQYDMQQSLSKRYLHERSLLDEVIFKILNRASNEPIEKRIDFDKVEQYIRYELSYNGLNGPFSFQIVDFNNKVVYASPGFSTKNQDAIYTQILFPNDPPAKLNRLRVYFPTKRNYVYSELSFFIPSLLFTFILLITFIFTVVSLFRQKRLSEMKNDFINNMTHELKTPVALIKGFAETLARDDAHPDVSTVREFGQIIADESDRLTRLIDNLLNAARVEAGGLSISLVPDVALDKIAAQSAAAFREQTDRHTIDVDFPNDFVPIHADPHWLRQLLDNLLANAIKYSPNGGRIQVRGGYDSANVYVSVTAEGLGLSPEEQTRIFTRFYRAPDKKRMSKGAGLGLYLCKSVVEAHGGQINVHSEEGKGATFTFALPREAKSAKTDENG